MIAQALDHGKKGKWTVIMVGGGHFAAAIFQSMHLINKTYISIFRMECKQNNK